MNQAVLLVHLSNPFQVMLLDFQLTQLTKYDLFKPTVSLDKPTVSLEKPTNIAYQVTQLTLFKQHSLFFK